MLLYSSILSSSIFLLKIAIAALIVRFDLVSDMVFVSVIIFVFIPGPVTSFGACMVPTVLRCEFVFDALFALIRLPQFWNFGR